MATDHEFVTIPTTSNPYRVIVNGVEYKYEAGATVEVPPKVAAAINASVNAAADLVKPGEVQPPFGASWNDLTDKLFYEKITVVNEPLNITWDGNTDGLLVVDGLLYKVSDLVLTDEQLKAAISVTSNGRTFVNADMWDNLVDMGLVTEDIVSMGESFACVRKAGAVSLDRVFPETGIYIVKVGDNYTTSITTTEPIEQVYTELKKIDEKFLPAVSGGGSDLTPIYIIDQDNVFSSSATFEEVWQLPANVLASRLIFTRNTSTVDLGHGESCCGVTKLSSRAFGDSFVLRFVLRSPSSNLTCVTEGIVLVWHSGGIERMTSDED